jgi:hypothetical protein
MAGLAMCGHIDQLHTPTVLVMMPRPLALPVGLCDTRGFVRKPKVLLRSIEEEPHRRQCAHPQLGTGALQHVVQQAQVLVAPVFQVACFLNETCARLFARTPYPKPSACDP